MEKDTLEILEQAKVDAQQERKNFDDQLVQDKQSIIELNQKLARSYVDLAEIQSKLTSSEDARRTLKGEKEGLSDKLDRTKVELNDVRSQRAKLEMELGDERSKTCKLTDQLKASQMHNETKNANIEDLEKANRTLWMQLAELANNMPQSDSQLKAALDTEREEHSKSKAALKHLRDDNESLQLVIATLQSEFNNETKTAKSPEKDVKPVKKEEQCKHIFELETLVTN